MKKAIIFLLLFFVGTASAQEERNTYEIALERIEEAERTGARQLSLSNLWLVELPPEIGNLSQLEILDLGNNRLIALPPQFSNLASLSHLYFDNNGLDELPIEITSLDSLEVLYFTSNDLDTLPSSIDRLQRLRVLYLDNNHLLELPSEIGNLGNLEYLSLASNQLQDLPSEIVRLNKLIYLNLSYNQFQNLPSFLGLMPGLWSSPENCDNYYLLCSVIVDANPLISPPQEVIEEGTPAILDYLRNEAWWHLQKLIVSGLATLGVVTLFVLGIRWRNLRGKQKRKNTV